MMAIAWSYAAARHLKIDPALLFHDEYRGGGPSILAAFTESSGFGVPMLQWIGLTRETKQAAALGVAGFPHMLRWLRQA
jgi:hypothetical protein